MVSCRPVIWILTAGLLLASCRSFESDTPTPDSGIEETSIPETSTPAPDYVTRLRNAEYQLSFVDSLRIVQLTDGKFEQGAAGGADFVSVIMTDYTAKGDLDHDGRDEYAALVAENYGGTGVFVFLAVFSEINGKLVFQTSTWVDDRPQVSELSIDNGEIFLDVTTHKTDEPMCCPTFHSTRHYRLVNNQLDVIDYVTFTPDDRPRTISIESPVNGTDVFNSIQIKGNVAIAPFENNLVYRIFDVGGVELAVGSITVSTPDLGAPGTFDENILLGGILSGAVIRVEVQDISAEDGLLIAMDSVELVVK
jgi:hypothetical protein